MERRETSAWVLLADRDPRFCAALEANLRRQRLHPERVGEGKACVEVALRLHPDVVVVADRLPDARASEVLASLRTDSDVPAIVLLKAGGIVTELLHFGLGADDVVWLPASPRIVTARVARLIRRPSADRERLTWRVGALLVDHYQHMIEFDDQAVDVTPLEYRLLAALAEAPGRAFSRSELIDEAMPESDTLERAIDVHIWSLRRKLESVGALNVLETVRGVGYRLSEPAPPKA